jgi:hypothetical protein
MPRAMNLEVSSAVEPALVMFHQFSYAGCLSSLPDVAVAVDADVDVAFELHSVGDP